MEPLNTTGILAASAVVPIAAIVLLILFTIIGAILFRK